MRNENWQYTRTEASIVGHNGGRAVIHRADEETAHLREGYHVLDHERKEHVGYFEEHSDALMFVVGYDRAFGKRNPPAHRSDQPCNCTSPTCDGCP